jgi:murein DD-endopeptidase MepM/ murein hydrolase activator NlpD
VVPAPAALELPWPPPGNFVINTYGGPLDGLAAIWGNLEFPISQEYGHTEFSIAHFSWYAYGLGFGLDGFEHPGLDIGMPAGTWLYSPVEGTVKVSGGTPHYTFYGNGQPNVGQLSIITDEGHEVILGHMGRIAVNVGDRVEVGQFVGLSGGDNGDHLHLEVRELQQGTWYRIVDPRKSFVVDVLREAAEQDVEGPVFTGAEPQDIEEPSAIDTAPVPPLDASPRTSGRSRSGNAAS